MQYVYPDSRQTMNIVIIIYIHNYLEAIHIHKYDVSSKGEGGWVKNVGIYLVKRRQRGRGHKIGKMGRRRLWMAP